MTTVIEIHPLAYQEGRKAFRWYRRRSLRAAVKFQAAVETAFDQIEADPDRWPAHLRGTQFRKVPRYPYLVIYRRLDSSQIFVIAIAHKRRRPGYWARRE